MSRPEIDKSLTPLQTFANCKAMTKMVPFRRPARKSEPNLTSIELINPSPPSIRRYNGSGISVSGGAVEHNIQTQKRRRSWFWRCSKISSATPTNSSTSSLTSRDRRYKLPRLRLLDRMKSFTNKRTSIQLTFIGIFIIILLVSLLHFLTIKLFGPQGSIKGGDIGNMLDQYVKDKTRYKTISKWRDEVNSQLHIPIVFSGQEGTLIEPWYYPLDVIIKTRPNSAVIEMLLREKHRVQILDSMIQNSDDILEICSRDDETSFIGIPTTVLQLVPHREQPTLPPYWIARSEIIDLNSIAIHNSDINDHLSQAIKTCQEFLRSKASNTDLQCVAYHLGGVQLSSNYFALEQSRPFINTILTMMGSAATHNLPLGDTCNSRLGYAVFSNSPTPDEYLRKSSAISSHVSTTFAAFPPNHPMYLCIPPLEQTIRISPYNEANVELSSQSTFANKLITEIESRHFNSSSQVWGLATLTCDLTDTSKGTVENCCNQVSVSILDSLNVEDIAKYLQSSNTNHHLIFTSSKLTAANDKASQSDAVSVKINEISNNMKAQRKHKESIQLELRNVYNCEPSWWCNRCLMQSGSFLKCASTCGKCAINAICNEDGTASKGQQIITNVQVTGFHPQQQHRIPRIIHQTYFEEITIEKYPQLLRLQNTWKASGWEYRFYDDDAARKYIETNYPSRFVSVFEALLPGAYKADFFRYLVLFKEGGIYVDVDVMLNTNLDTFITPDLAFFAPLDAVGTFADEQYCLWNGLLGSAPAYPALANVIEWMVNLVSNRGDMYDMERTVCAFSGVDKLENWKIRTEPGLMLSGPCALGFAVNNALGNEPLSKFTSGLLRNKEYNTKNIKDLNSEAIGNVMILAVSLWQYKVLLLGFVHSHSHQSI